MAIRIFIKTILKYKIIIITAVLYPYPYYISINTPSLYKNKKTKDKSTNAKTRQENNYLIKETRIKQQLDLHRNEI